MATRRSSGAARRSSRAARLAAALLLSAAPNLASHARATAASPVVPVTAYIPRDASIGPILLTGAADGGVTVTFDGTSDNAWWLLAGTHEPPAVLASGRGQAAGDRASSTGWLLGVPAAAARPTAITLLN